MGSKTVMFVAIPAIIAAFAVVVCAQESAEEKEAADRVRMLDKAIEDIRSRKTLTDEDKKLIESLHSAKKRLTEMKEYVKESRSQLKELGVQANVLLREVDAIRITEARQAVGDKDYLKAAGLLNKVLEGDPENKEACKLIEEILPLASPPAYRNRWYAAVPRAFKDNRLKVGQSPGTTSAAFAALRWLHFHQNSEQGKWDQNGFQEYCDTRKSPACDGQADSGCDVGVTGLALLAFMGSGYTHRTGIFKETVKKGLDWLLAQQRGDGSFGERTAESWVYNHAIAAQALCEAYALTRDPKLEEPAKKAIDFILKNQQPGSGWGYFLGDRKINTSVTGWMVLALHAAKNADIEVPDSALEGALKWLDEVTDPGGRTGFIIKGVEGPKVSDSPYEQMPVMTAIGVLCRILCGQDRESDAVKRGVSVLMKKMPDWNKPENTKVDMYYWFFGTYAMFQYGGRDWHKWNTAMKRALLDTQRVGGCADGSWDPVGKWGDIGGRVYATAINCLTLQVYHRYKMVGSEEETLPEGSQKSESESGDGQDSAEKTPPAREKVIPRSPIEKQASQLLGKARYFDQANPYEDKAVVAAKYREVFQKYPGTEAAEEALKIYKKVMKRKR